jgi:predicted phosphodiesterase
MYCVTADYPAEWPDTRIYILSDLHIGDANADWDEIHARVQRIADDERGLCVLNGDLLNTAVRNSVSDIYSETVPPMEQIKMAVELLSPIRKRIIAADTGNHENRVYRTDGLDMMRLICRELGIEHRYAPEGVLCFLRFGDKAPGERSGGRKKQPYIYTIYATHGTGGGRKEGAKAIRLADMAGIVDADCYIHSHSHMPMILKQAFFRVDIQNRKATPVDKLFVNDAAAVSYGGYGQAGEFKPASKHSPVIHLSGNGKAMKATL